mmetsp:Transcript_101087/g.309139  ORF Transcript_101087/g.309139 Transcript_101087/m.309139 type:complete len:204 (-) Transcript_101087:380-991(-)
MSWARVPAIWQLTTGGTALACVRNFNKALAALSRTASSSSANKLAIVGAASMKARSKPPSGGADGETCCETRPSARAAARRPVEGVRVSAKSPAKSPTTGAARRPSLPKALATLPWQRTTSPTRHAPRPSPSSLSSSAKDARKRFPASGPAARVRTISRNVSTTVAICKTSTGARRIMQLRALMAACRTDPSKSCKFFRKCGK